MKRQADAERYRVETEAAAAKARAELEAQGQATSIRQRGQADADVIRVTGTSEAEITALKGAAEAEAMSKKADRSSSTTRPRCCRILIEALPEIARAVSEPLSKTESITMISTGGEGPGASKLTADVAKVMAEVPAVVESLSGIDLGRLAESLPSIGEAIKEAKKPKPAPRPPVTPTGDAGKETRTSSAAGPKIGFEAERLNSPASSMGEDNSASIPTFKARRAKRHSSPLSNATRHV